MREFLVSLCRLVLRLYFRRVELTGLEHVPASGPLMFVLNHPNGLLDPVFVLCLSGRRVSFLAKEPLFRMPVVGIFVRAFECLPVQRARDGGDPAKNRSMLQRAIQLLQQGNALALFPEGTSHSDPKLRPFRSGAARIALAASSPTLNGEPSASWQPVKIVPCGLYYNRKARFRSNAVVSFAEPITCPMLPLNERLEPAPEDTAQLTRALEQALRKVVVHADSVEALQLAQRAERLLRGADSDTVEQQPDREEQVQREAQRFRLRQRLVEGYEQLRVKQPEALAQAITRLEDVEEFLYAHGLRVEQRVLYPKAQVLRQTLLGIVVGTLLLPWALVGLLSNLATYWLLAWAVGKYTKGEEDVVATAKVVGGLLFYPLTWLLLALGVGLSCGGWWGVAALLLSPVAAFAALAFVERATRELTRSVVIAKLAFRPGLKQRIVQQRSSVRDTLLALAQHVDASG